MDGLDPSEYHRFTSTSGGSDGTGCGCSLPAIVAVLGLIFLLGYLWNEFSG